MHPLDNGYYSEKRVENSQKKCGKKYEENKIDIPLFIQLKRF